MPFVVTDPPPVVTPAPPMTQFAQDAYAYLEPIAGPDPDNGYVLRTIIGALGEAFRQVEEIARAQPGREPYQQVYDITRTPDYLLPWLGQFLGQPIDPTASPDVQRATIIAEPHFYRGTIQNLVAAAQATQTGGGRVTVLERNPTAWDITVGYDPAYTPDVTALTNAAKAAAVWGLGVVITSNSIPIVDQGALTIDSVAGGVTIDSAALTDIT